MMKVPGLDGKTYTVVSWGTFRAWVRRFGVSYVLLVLALTIGIWQVTIHEKNTIVDEINDFVSANCMQNGKANAQKFNDIIDNIIMSRKKALTDAIAAGDLEAAKDHQAAIARFEKNYIHIPTDEECMVPILKK